MRGSPGPDALAAQRLVDAVRECLGLAPLYSNPYRTERQRFERGDVVSPWQGWDENGNRTHAGGKRAGA